MEENIKLTDSEIESLAAMMAMPGWDLFSKLIQSAQQIALQRCGSVTTDHRFYQGIVAGLAEIQSGMQKYKEFAARKPAGEKQESAGDRTRF